MGQPNEETQLIDNPIVVNNVLSFLIYGTTKAEVTGLDRIPRDQWPSALPLLFYSYHIMAGLGTFFVILDAGCGVSAVAEEAVRIALDSVDIVDQFSVCLISRTPRVDDGGDWAAAVADLRPDADE